MTQPDSPAASSDALDAKLQQGIHLHKQGKAQEAEAVYQTILEANPDHPNALQLMGALYASRGEMEKAIPPMQRSLALDPGQSHVYANLARAYFQMQAYPKAEKTVKEGLKHSPHSLELMGILGDIYQRRNLSELAANLFQQALKLAPENISLQLRYAVAQMSSGQKDEAETIFRNIMEKHPDRVESYNGLGTILQNRGQLDEAIALFEKGIDIAPNNPEAHTNLGFALYEKQLHDRSIEASQKSITLKPHNPIAYNNLSIALHALGRVKEAEAAGRKAIEQDPNNARAANNLANALHAQGKNKEATEFYARAVALNPAYTQAYRNMSQIKKFDRKTDAHLINHMQSLITSERLSKPQEMHLHFALGKAFEDMKEYDKSFDHYAKGNAEKRREYGVFSTESVKAYFDEIKTTFAKEAIASIPDSGLEDNTPIFILGMPRSGTTLVEQILASHPDVYGAEELNYIGNIAHGGAAQFCSQPYPQCIEEANPELLAKMGQAYVNLLRTRHDATSPHITDKMPGNFQFIGLIRKILPHAKIIYCKRNPMDNCFSIFKYYFTSAHRYAYDLKDLGEYYLLHEDLMQHWKSVFGDAIFEVEYEKMTAESESLIPELVTFCGLEWNDACLNFHRTKRTVRTASATQVRKPIYTSSVQAWKHYETQLEPLKTALHYQE